MFESLISKRSVDGLAWLHLKSIAKALIILKDTKRKPADRYQLA